MKYTVFIKEINWGFVKVEADSEEEAKDKAANKYYDGHIYWGDADMEIADVEENE